MEDVKKNRQQADDNSQLRKQYLGMLLFPEEGLAW